MTDISGINPVSDGSTRHYTPTTEEVREVYQCRLIKVGDNRFQLIDQVEADAEFDRWLAEVKAEVWLEGYRKGRALGITHFEMPINPYAPKIGKTPQHFPETGNNV